MIHKFTNIALLLLATQRVYQSAIVELKPNQFYIEQALYGPCIKEIQEELKDQVEEEAGSQEQPQATGSQLPPIYIDVNTRVDGTTTVNVSENNNQEQESQTPVEEQPQEEQVYETQNEDDSDNSDDNENENDSDNDDDDDDDDERDGGLVGGLLNGVGGLVGGVADAAGGLTNSLLGGGRRLFQTSFANHRFLQEEQVEQRALNISDEMKLGLSFQMSNLSSTNVTANEGGIWFGLGFPYPEQNTTYNMLLCKLVFSGNISNDQFDCFEGKYDLRNESGLTEEFGNSSISDVESYLNPDPENEELINFTVNLKRMLIANSTDMLDLQVGNYSALWAYGDLNQDLELNKPLDENRGLKDISLSLNPETQEYSDNQGQCRYQ